MNKSRRALANSLAGTLRELSEKLGNVNIDSLKDEEESAFDALPEGLQTSERREALDALENAVSALESAQQYLDDAIEALEGAANA